jgi:hypothetical protein
VLIKEVCRVLVSRLINAARIRAKSDWYWRCGANRVIASALGSTVSADETNHDLIAALTCLPVGMQLSGHAADGSKAMAIGDSTGTYAVPVKCHPAWEGALKGKIYAGTAAFILSPSIFHPSWDTPFRKDELALRKQQERTNEVPRPGVTIGSLLTPQRTLSGGTDSTHAATGRNQAGAGRTTEPGFENRNAQLVIRSTGLHGTDHGQSV